MTISFYTYICHDILCACVYINIKVFYTSIEQYMVNTITHSIIYIYIYIYIYIKNGAK